MTFKTRMSVLALSTPVLAFVLVGGLMGNAQSSGQQNYQHLRVFDEVVQLVLSSYVGEVQVDKVSQDLDAPVAGVMYQLVAEGVGVRQGEPVARID